MQRWRKLQVVAITALCCVWLSGCSQAGGCSQAVGPAPQVAVDVEGWVSAHPDTTVRVCLGSNCSAGDDTVVVRGDVPKTPFDDRSKIQVSVETLRGSMVVQSEQRAVPVTPDRCGQWSTHLQLSRDGKSNNRNSL